MKSCLNKISAFVIFLLSYYVAYPQGSYIDSLNRVLQTQPEDSTRVKALTSLSYYYLAYSADTAADYAQKALNLAKKIDFEEGVYEAIASSASSLMISGNYLLALDNDFNFLSLAKKKKDTVSMSIANALIGECYYDLGDYNTSLKYYRENLKLTEICCVNGGMIFPWANMAHVYHSLSQPDSAMVYARKAYEIVRNWSDTLFVSTILGDAYAGKGKYDSALRQYRISIYTSLKNHTQFERIDGYNGIALVYKTIGKPDSAAWYSKKALSEKIEKSYPLGFLRAANMLADIYGAQNNSDSALKYLKIALNVKDSLFGREKTMAIQNLAFKEQERQRELEVANLQSQNRLKMYSLLGGLFTVLAIAGLLFRNNRQKQKANTFIIQQKQKVESTLAELKATQGQLIQSEKMASLGELTAGIAHEIQNPLNFVNNFSEVNRELIGELKSQKSKLKNEEVDELLDDIAANEEKILHHGKRADAIVKGMLQHSRSSTAVKEPTDINALADEYLRLSYHGLRAKDKDFNAAMKTDFDTSIGKINIIPQDVGRVLLNLYNNAFYAVAERLRQVPPDSNYEPKVTVSTKAVKPPSGGLGVEIAVSDNGNGIPQNIVDKIFQPFFTTKPTGQGTGLGLSLSYDIIKAHGGEIKVASNEIEGTTFIIQLPVV